jgi:accessory gene regulator protein AgrB
MAEAAYVNFEVFWYDPTGIRAHDLRHSRWARKALHHRYGLCYTCLWEILSIIVASFPASYNLIGILSCSYELYILIIDIPYKPSDKSWKWEEPGSVDKWNISVVICDTDIP